MSVIVGVHGTEKELEDETTLHEEWYPALCEGLRRAGATPPDPGDFSCAFYGDLFRKSGAGSLRARHDRAPGAVSGCKSEIYPVHRWAKSAGPSERSTGTSDDTPIPLPVQRALSGLSRSRFLTGMAERMTFGGMPQVRGYLRDPAVRSAARARVEQAVTADTRVIIGHSLGSVVAYECLCTHPEWPVTTLVTIGSPLGIPNLIFDQLQPAPCNGRGAWPGPATRWINLCHRGDMVTLVKTLGPLFHGRVEDYVIHSESHAHNVTTYLRMEETGRAIAGGLI